MVEGDEIQNDDIPLRNDDEEMTPKDVAIGVLTVGLPISISIYMGWAWYSCCLLMILPVYLVEWYQQLKEYTVGLWRDRWWWGGIIACLILFSIWFYYVTGEMPFLN
jgi:hypothetical protein